MAPSGKTGSHPEFPLKLFGFEAADGASVRILNNQRRETRRLLSRPLIIGPVALDKLSRDIREGLRRGGSLKQWKR